MSLKQSNEITVKIRCELSEIYKILEEKGFKVVDKYSIDDTYFIPKELNLQKMTTREILSKGILVRCIKEISSNKEKRKITFKIKDIDESGNILKQESINCDIINTEDAKKLLEAIGYKEIMNIKEDDIVYEKDRFELAIKDIKNGDKLIEIETADSKDSDTIEKLIQKVNEIDIPIHTDNYFVKKAEIELDKVLKRDVSIPKEKCCGCIIIENGKVLLVQHTKGHWGFPKGHVEGIETEEETALREVKEETNIDVEIESDKRYTMEYVTDKGIEKEVIFFIAKSVGGKIKPQVEEINMIKWLDFEEAIEIMQYDNIKNLFKKVLKDIQ